MKPRISLRGALADPLLLGSALGGDTWKAWRSLLLAAMGEPLEPDELAIFQALTSRSESPRERVEELWVVAGRRGGKSHAIGSMAVYLAALVNHREKLTAGERGVVLCIAPDQRQAKVVHGYAAGIMDASPILRQMVAGRTAETLSLTTRIDIEVRAASFRRLRGLTAIAVIADEAAFWPSDEASTNPDAEILNAARPMLATTGGPLIVISSPYGKRGAVWETFRQHFGPKGDPSIIVAQGASRAFNPSLPQKVVDRALERDPESARAEYLAQFRDDVQTFVSPEAVAACVSAGVYERPPVRGFRYLAFVDPSGGSSDSMTLGVAHLAGQTAILDAVREIRPPFSPEAVVAEFSALLKIYSISTVVGDRFAGQWPREQFRKHGILYVPSAAPKSDLYRDLLPLINSGACELLDHRRLVAQLTNLERHTARGGRDSIDHPPGGHDDVANAAAGALYVAAPGRVASSFFVALLDDPWPAGHGGGLSDRQADFLWP